MALPRNSCSAHRLHIGMMTQIFKLLFFAWEKFYECQISMDKTISIKRVIQLITLYTVWGLFYDGGLWGKCSLGQRGIFSPNTMIDHWTRLYTNSICVIFIYSQSFQRLYLQCAFTLWLKWKSLVNWLAHIRWVSFFIVWFASSEAFCCYL